MSTFRLEPNGVIYLYHWITPKQPFKASTKLKIEKSKWNSEKMRPRSSSFVYNGINVTKELIRIESVFHSSWNYFQINGGFSPIKLRKKFKELLNEESGMSTTNGKPRFLDFFTETLEGYKSTMKRNSWKGYNTTLLHLNNFFGRRIPNFEDIDMAFYNDYSEFLREQGLSINTISTHWKFIKAIMRQAQYRRLHANTDYLRFKRFQESSDTIFLTMDELQKIYELELRGYLNKARDYFIVGCYSGLRYDDWERIDLSMIKDNEQSIRSKKTGEVSVIPIHEKVLTTLHKYKEGKLPSKPTNQKMNLFIKEVVKRAGIIDPVETRITKGGNMVITIKPKYELVSTHTARRSLATNLILQGTSPYLVMKITGHKSLANFEKYIRFDELQASMQLKNNEFFKHRVPDGEKAKTTLSEKDRKKLLLL